MFKRFAIRSLAVLASLIAIVPAFAAELPIKGQSESGITRYPLKIPTTAGVNDFTAKIPACENMSVYWERGNSAQVTLYPADSDDTTATLIDDNTPIRVFTTTERYGPFTPTKAYVSFVVNTVNASVPSKILVNCSNFASSGGGVEVITNDMLAELGDQNVIYQVTDATDGTDCAVGTDGTETAFCGWDGAAYIPVGVAAAGDEMDAAQSVPSAGEYYARTRGTITNPASVNFGYGVGFGLASGGFVTETYPSSGVSGMEPDNLIGPYYNANPCSSIRLNIYEHGMEDCYELNFNETVGTGGFAQVEHNWDVEAPDVQAVITGVTGTPVAGNYVTFSGGGTGKILSWNGGTSTLVWRHLYGTTANSQTVAWTGGGGTVTTIAANNTDSRWRPRLENWNVGTQVSEFGWYIDEASGELPYMLMRNGEIRIGTTDLPNAQLLVGAPGGLSSIQTIGNIDLGYEAVRLTPGTATSGEFTIAGRGTGTDESLTFNFNSANVVTVTSSTGVSTINFPDGSIPAADIVGGGTGDHVQIGSNLVADALGVNFNLANLGFLTTFDDTVSPDNVELEVDYSLTLAGNPAFAAERCWFTTDGTGGGGFICEGTGTAATEQLYLFPAVNGADTTSFIATGNTAITFAGPTAARTVTLPDADFTVARRVASGTVVLDTDAIASGDCDTSDTGITATNVLSSDVVSWSFVGDVSGVTGYNPVTTGGLMIYHYTGADSVSFKVCNPTASSITPSSAVTLNWNVVR